MKIRLGFVSNSSSEAFICRSGYSVEETKAILQKMLTFHNEMFDSNLDFDDAFEYPRIVTEEDIKLLEDYGNRLDKTDKESVFILSKGDNTIPYSMLDMISRKFDAYRTHLG